MKPIRPFSFLSLSICATLSSNGATTLFSDRSTFENALVTLERVDYSGIASGSYTDAQIDSILGPTAPIHRTTGGLGTNQVFQNAFNASNTTFLITFTNTNLGTADGVYGAGFNYGQVATRKSAFVTFGDNSTQEYTLAANPSPFSTPDFFGITSDQSIKSIHVSIPTNVAGFTNTTIVMDDLTYGGNTIPEPSTALLSLIPLAALGCRRHRG